MPYHIVLTRDEANQILALLSELPIKYLGLVQQVQQLLATKFCPSAESPHVPPPGMNGSTHLEDREDGGHGYAP